MSTHLAMQVLCGGNEWVTQVPKQWPDTAEGLAEAWEYADKHGDRIVRVSSETEVVDRPAPPVVLPTEPTLGWLATGGHPIVGVWETYRPFTFGNEKGLYALSRERDFRVEDVTSFVEATAVPTSALDRLRKIHLSREGCGELKCGSFKDIRTFLAAIDNAATS